MLCVERDTNETCCCCLGDCGVKWKASFKNKYKIWCEMVIFIFQTVVCDSFSGLLLIFGMFTSLLLSSATLVKDRSPTNMHLI